jgi:hypothetical protein
VLKFLAFPAAALMLRRLETLGKNAVRMPVGEWFRVSK